MQKDLKITILGKSYFVSTDERSEYVQEAANMVDTLMKTNSQKSQLQSESRLAVSIALQLATELVKKQHLIEAWEKKAMGLGEVLDNATGG